MAFVLTPELAAFCQSGISIVVASTGPDLLPLPGRALACRIDGERVRLVLSATENAAVLQAIAAGQAIAATFTVPMTHKSIQLKAASARVEPARLDDETFVAEQCESFRRWIVSINYPETFAHHYCAWRRDDLGALSFVPTAAFEQTPGPDAGNVLPRSQP